MGFCCYKCPENALFKTVLMDNTEPNNKTILIKVNPDSKSYNSEEKNNFSSQKSVFKHNQKINNQNHKKPEKDDMESKNTDHIVSSIYEKNDEEIYSSKISEGNN